MFKNLDQKSRDHERRTYKLIFPSNLEAKQTQAWLRSLSGTLSPHRLTGHDSVVFETWAIDGEISHYMKIPWRSDAEFIVGQLGTMAPGVVASREEAPEHPDWTYAAEVGMKNLDRSLEITSPEELSHRLLTALGPLGDGEALLMQWVVTSANRQPRPSNKSTEFNWMTALLGTTPKDVIDDARSKLSEANMLGVLRLAATAKTKPRAKHLVHNLGKALNSTRTPYNSLVRREVPASMVKKRLNLASGMVMYPSQLSLTELSALMGWPLGNAFIPGLPQSRTRQMPANNSVPRDGIIIGKSNVSGHERPIAITYEAALEHTFISGGSGTGKTEVLAHVARQAMNAGAGLIVMETEGNLYQRVLDYVPKHRRQDVILLDVGDRDFPVGFNVLDQGNTAGVVDELISLLTYKFGNNSMGIWSKEYLYHGLKTIGATPGLSFIDLLPLLNPSTEDEVAWADEIVRNVPDHELKRWWQRHENRRKQEQQQRADPVLSRIWELTSRPELRYIMGQSQSSFKMTDVLASNKILLINLKHAPQGTVALAGTLLMNAIWYATKTTPKTTPTYVILDEFGDFMDLPINTESMLAQARKHNVGLVLATQYLEQLKPSVRDAVLNNTVNKLVLRVGEANARTMVREMAGNLKTEDFQNLQLHEGIARIGTPTGISTPMTLTTIPPFRVQSYANQIISHSRATYGRSVQEVRQQIEERNKPKATKKPKPKPNSVGWDDV